MLAVRDRHLEAVFARDELAFELRDLFELIGPHGVELHDHALFQHIFVLLAHCLSLRAILDLWINEYSPLHALHLERAGDKRLDLGLPDLAKQVQVGAVVLLMGVEPVEGESTIVVEFERVLLVLLLSE